MAIKETERRKERERAGGEGERETNIYKIFLHKRSLSLHSKSKKIRNKQNSNIMVCIEFCWDCLFIYKNKRERGNQSFLKE